MPPTQWTPPRCDPEQLKSTLQSSQELKRLKTDFLAQRSKESRGRSRSANRQGKKDAAERDLDNVEELEHEMAFDDLVSNTTAAAAQATNDSVAQRG